MWVEAVFSAFDRSSRANDGTVEINRDASKFSVCPSREGDVTKKLIQPIAVALTDVLQPTRQGSFRRQTIESSDTQEDRVDRQLAQIRQSSPTDQDQPDHRQSHSKRAIVGIEVSIRKDLSDSVRPLRRSKEVPDQREAGMGRQSLRRKTNRKRTLDTGPNESFSKSH